MKTNRLWIFAIAVLVALSGTRALAQDHDQRDERNRDEHTRFADRDREAARGWYKEHRDHFNDRDRLSQEEVARIHEGAILDHELRHRIHSLPHDLAVRLGPAPRHERYVLVGRHVVLVDSRYRVLDVIHLEE